MAAYAALNSVMLILQQIQHHPRPPITIQKQQMDSLSEIISFLQDFLEKYSHRDIGDGKEALESQIANTAYAAEDIIESHIVDQILAKSNFVDLFCRGVKKMIRTLACSNNLFCQNLQKVIKDMNLIKNEVVEIQGKIREINDDQLPRNIISLSENIIGSSTVPHPKRKNTNYIMVGFDDVLMQIMDRLTGYPTNRQVLPIVGMGGIGKTTLATHAYDNPLIVKYFDIRIWITISQEYIGQDILVSALSQIGKIYENDENKDGCQLHKSLCGRRYLIVLDDLWSIEAWEKLMLYFPDDNNGSRIMITTRLSNVSNHFGSCGFKMNLLDEDKSWNLLCKIVFAQDQCYIPELEEIGKKIAKNCKGLPLSIAVIGGLLANSEKTQKHWKYIAENLNSIVNLEDNMHCLNILYLSYNHLPIHLKPCFLYTGVFPEDTEIAVSCLKKLWVAEGLLKPLAAKSLEVVAEEYLNDLIDRNLILVHKLGSSGKVKYCKIHDLLRDLCLREAKKDKFLWLCTVHGFENLEGIQNQRRISVHKSFNYNFYRVLKAMPSASCARSFICDFNGDHLFSHNFRLVRVFSLEGIYQNVWFAKKKSIVIPVKIYNSRYIAFQTKKKPTSVLPSSIHLLWNLQTLIIKKGVIEVPPEIWEMSELRHLEIDGFSLPYPPNVPLTHEGDDGYFILRSLHTLKRVINFKLSDEVIKRIPNIKKLQLFYDEGRWHNYCLNNLGLLNKLESLHIDTSYSDTSFQIEVLQNFAFPHTLKKLILWGTRLLWEDMGLIGSLPCLEVLKLGFYSFIGQKWYPIEGEFLRLKFLLIEWCNDLVYWNANSTHFPCLEQLVLRKMIYLKEIPLDIGQIPTLRSIELFDCCNSVIMSAKDLLDEQVDLGNEDLQVRVICQNNVELVSLVTDNFQVESLY